VEKYATARWANTKNTVYYDYISVVNFIGEVVSTLGTGSGV
jgi:hypothetical protein